MKLRINSWLELASEWDLRHLDFLSDFYLFYDAYKGTDCQRCKGVYIRHVIAIYRSIEKLDETKKREIKKGFGMSDAEVTFYFEERPLFTI